MKNILQVMPEFGLAGAEIMCENLVYELITTGNHHIIVASLYNFHSPITDRLEEKGIKVYYLGKSKGVDFSIIYRLAKIMKEEHIDVVHTHRYVMQYAIPAAILAGVKIRVHTIHNVAQKEVDSFRQKLAYFFYKHCSVVPVSISPIVQQTVLRRYRLNYNQSPVVYNGIDLEKCIIKTNYHFEGTFRFVHIGRFNLQKNHVLMINAAVKLAADGYRFQILFVGGAGNEQERQKQVHELGLDEYIVFCGVQSNVFHYLHDADCFLLPSLYEGMPVTLVEAMGSGMPIIASEVGGVPDMIKNDFSGLLICPTEEELVDAMIRVMKDEALRERIGRNALKESKKFSVQKMCKGYVDIYNGKTSSN